MNDSFEDIKLRVKHGIYWLDENHPNWENNIDLSRLDLQDCEHCVIGQAVGDYVDIIGNAGDDSWSYDNGFSASGLEAHKTDNVEAYFNNYYETLDELWTEEVKKRIGE